MEIIHFYGITDKDALSYKVNEIITFTIYPASGTEILACKEIIYYKWEIQYDFGRSECGYTPVNGMPVPLTLTARLDSPGFVRVIVEACDKNKLPLQNFIRFEGGAGVDVDKIKTDTKTPDNFDEFWNSIKKVVETTDVSNVCLKKIDDNENQDFEIYEVKIDIPDNTPSQGILTYPKKDCVFNAEIRFMGYGVIPTPINCVDNKITLTVNAHGIAPNEKQEYYDSLYREPDGELFYYGFDNIENSRPETSYFKGMMLRNLVALKFLKSHPKWNHKNITAQGGSQGALQATTIAAQDDAITYLDIAIPWLCNVGGYKSNWKSDIGRIRGWSPDYTYGLTFFDTAIQAKKVKCPVKITARLGDYICPPSGVMALYNNLNTQKQIEFYQNGTHGYQSPVEIISTLKN